LDAINFLKPEANKISHVQISFDIEKVPSFGEEEREEEPQLKYHCVKYTVLWFGFSFDFKQNREYRWKFPRREVSYRQWPNWYRKTKNHIMRERYPQSTFQNI
jgi:hypothetical protein